MLLVVVDVVNVLVWVDVVRVFVRVEVLGVAPGLTMHAFLSAFQEQTLSALHCDGPWAVHLASSRLSTPDPDPGGSPPPVSTTPPAADRSRISPLLVNETVVGVAVEAAPLATVGASAVMLVLHA